MNIENITLDDIYAFIESKTKTISPEIEKYLDLMDKVRGMYLRIGDFGSRDSIVNHLMRVEKLSRYLAQKVYNDALEYFYCENEISKQAWRNLIAEKHEKLINMAIEMAKDVNDLSKIAKMNMELGTLRELDKEDPIELPLEVFQKPFKLYSYDAEMLGLPTKVDRKKLLEFINELPELTEKERQLILQESLYEPLNLFPEDHENVRKSE